VEKIRRALYASKIVSYAQGFMLLREAGVAYNWNLNYGGIALMWRGGCIIRSAFLGKIKEAFERGKLIKGLLYLKFNLSFLFGNFVDPDLPCLLLDEFFRDALHNCQVIHLFVV